MWAHLDEQSGGKKKKVSSIPFKGVNPPSTVPLKEKKEVLSRTGEVPPRQRTNGKGEEKRKRRGERGELFFGRNRRGDKSKKRKKPGFLVGLCGGKHPPLQKKTWGQRKKRPGKPKKGEPKPKGTQGQFSRKGGKLKKGQRQRGKKNKRLGKPQKRKATTKRGSLGYLTADLVWKMGARAGTGKHGNEVFLQDVFSQAGTQGGP